MVIVWRRRDRLLRRRAARDQNLRGVDFSKARLVALDLRGKDLRGANLRGADLTEADLRGADLQDADLTTAFLTGAQLDGANLTGAVLAGSYLLCVNFGDAVLDGADLSGAVWDQATTWPPGFRPPRPKVGMWHGARTSKP